MSKRYVYFRAPNGTLHLGIDGKYAPFHVLAEIGKTAILNAEGNVSWQGFSLQRLEVSLKGCIAVRGPDGDELNETDTWRIMWQALVAVIKNAPGKPVIPKVLLTKADKLAAEFFRKPSLNYTLVTSLSITDLPAKAIRARKCIVSSLKARDKTFPLPTLLTRFQNASVFSRHINSSEYRLVKIATTGQSKYQAVDNAMKSLNLLRGLWSLFATYGDWKITYSNTPQRKPIGVIHIGPIQTLHLPNETPVENDIYWYQPDYTEDQSIFRPSEGWQQIEKDRRRAMKRLSVLNGLLPKSLR